MGKTTTIIVCILLFSATGMTKASDHYVNAETGNDIWDGASPTFQGDGVGPKATIQAAIGVAVDNDTIILADGTYTGPGNRDIEFYGKVITIQSENGPDYCIVDSQGTQASPHRAFNLDANSIVDGLTITNGFAWGSGISCVNSSPIIRNCIISQAREKAAVSPATMPARPLKIASSAKIGPMRVVVSSAPTAATRRY